jgi:hypothetical protein
MELRHQPEWRMKQKLYFAEHPKLILGFQTRAARSLLRNSAKHLKSLESGKMQFANDFKDFHVLRGHSATRS